jgi:hypothetical protein
LTLHRHLLMNVEELEHVYVAAAAFVADRVG